MNRVFADSYYFIALISLTEPKHGQAVEFANTYRGELVTTGWILTELGDGFARPPGRAAFVTLCDRIAQNASIRVAPCSDELLAAGLELYRSRTDKAWSLTDCISLGDGAGRDQRSAHGRSSLRASWLCRFAQIVGLPMACALVDTAS